MTVFTPTYDELDDLDAVALAGAVRSGTVSVGELVERSLERISSADSVLNAVTWIVGDVARLAAPRNGPFVGVPILLKDTMAEAADHPMTSGSALLRDFVGRRDSRTVRRLRDAGFVILGRTNMPEFGLLPTTESQLHGACRNPYRLTHTPGGSSGGAATAVAAGLVHIAHATDGGGSTRIPAACCSLFGLKPSRGRVPLEDGAIDALGGVTAELGVTRSVRDTAALLDVLSGPGHANVSATIERPIPPLRVGVVPRVLGHAPVDEVLIALTRVVEALDREGHILGDVELPLDVGKVSDALRLFYAMSAHQTLHQLGSVRGRSVTPDEVEPLTWALASVGSSLRAFERLNALDALRSAADALNTTTMGNFDILVVPTLVGLPVEVGRIHGGISDLDEIQQLRNAFAPNTALFNVTGQPVINIPAGLSKSSLPIGVQIVGRVGADELVLRVARQLESVGFAPSPLGSISSPLFSRQ